MSQRVRRAPPFMELATWMQCRERKCNPTNRLEASCRLARRIPWHHMPDGCACALDNCCLARLLGSDCSCEGCTPCGVFVGCGCSVECDAGCRGCSLCPHIEHGLPPVTNQPPMPPKFLPVPVRPVFTPVNRSLPRPSRGDVEVDFGPQIAFPGRD